MESFEIDDDQEGCAESVQTTSIATSYDEISLEYVSGTSSTNKCTIASNPSNGNIAFAASSILVLVDPKCPNQAFIENPSSREIGAVAFSDDGKYLAFGENGVNPSACVYNAKLFTLINKFQIDEAKCSVKALKFHPKSAYLALLLGYDYTIMIYDFINGLKLVTTKWCVEPLAMTFTKSDNILAVCGHRKISYFSLTTIEASRYQTNAPLDKKAVLLGKHGNYTFVDITRGDNKYSKTLYTVTSCGNLCEIQSGVIFIRNMLKISEKCFCAQFQLDFIFIGCEKGQVNICNPEDLTVVTNVCNHDILRLDQIHPMKWSVRSDTMAMAINPLTNMLTMLMSDQKMHSWSLVFEKDTVKCSPLILSREHKDANPVSRVVTGHDLQCTMAQLLRQLEIRNTKSKECNFLQRPSSMRHKQINAIKITPDGTEIIVGNKFGEIKIYEATTGHLKKVIGAHNAEVTFIDMMFDNECKLLATGGRDRLIFVLNASKNYKLVQTINDHSAAITSISLAHNNGILTLVSSSMDGVIIIRRAFREETPVFMIVGELPESVGSKKRVYNHSNGYIITGQEKGRINVFPADQNINLKPMKKLQVGNALLRTVVIDPTGSFFIAFSKDGQFVFHLQTGQQIATLCSLPGFNYLSFSDDLNYFINANDTGTKFFWRLPPKIVNIMREKMPHIDKLSTSHSSDVLYNSYMSCVRVYQQLIGGDVSKPEAETEQPKFVHIGDSSVVTEVESSREQIMELSQDQVTLEQSGSYNPCTSWSHSLTDVPSSTGPSIKDGTKNCLRSHSAHSLVPEKPKRQVSNDLPSDGGEFKCVASNLVLKHDAGMVKGAPRANHIERELPYMSDNTIPDDLTIESKSAYVIDQIELVGMDTLNSSSNIIDKTGCEKLQTPLEAVQNTVVHFAECQKGKNQSKIIDAESTANSESQAEETDVKDVISQNSLIEEATKLADNEEEVDRDGDEEKTELRSNKASVYTTISDLLDSTLDDLEKDENVEDSGLKRTDESPAEKDDCCRMGAEGEVLEDSILEIPDEHALHMYYREFWRNMQLSNYQETYAMKNMESNSSDALLDTMTLYTDESSILDGSFTTDATSTVNCVSSEESLLFAPELSMSGLQDGDVYRYDFYLKKVFLKWALKKLNKERKKRKQKMPITNEQNQFATSSNGKNESSGVSSLPPTAAEATTSTVSDKFKFPAADRNKYNTPLKRMSSREFPKLRQHLSDPQGNQTYNHTSIVTNYDESEPTQTAHSSSTEPPGNIPSLTKYHTETTRGREKSPCNKEAPHFQSRSNSCGRMGATPTSEGIAACRSPEISPEVDVRPTEPYSIADAFRSQDTYLRKIKEVRKNFERTLQALSAERKNHQMEAQKYFMKNY